MKSKKAATDLPMWLVVLVVSLLLLAISIGIFIKFSGSGFTLFGKEFASLEDCDGDTVINKLDDCPCDSSQKGIVANKGCSEGYKVTGTNTGREDRTCLTDTKLCLAKT